MGILEKRKRDRITKMRKEGYTQKEVAEAVGVHVRTVRKYDSVRGAGSVKGRSLEVRLTAVEEVVLNSLDVLYLMQYECLDPVDDKKRTCPRCGRDDMVYEVDELAFVCTECGHSCFAPAAICRQCLSVGEGHFDVDTAQWVCGMCGAKQGAEGNNSWADIE